MTPAVRIVLVLAAVAAAAIGPVAAGCGGSDEMGDIAGSASSTGSGAGGAGGATGAGGAGGSGPCAPTPGFDPIAAGLPSCCDQGAAHCVPVAEVPQGLASAFSTCDANGGAAGLCLPDAVILAGTSYSPASCSSIGSAAGVCLSKCIKAVASDPNASLLSQDTCASDELCVPCVSPLDNKPTGACDIKPCSAGAGGGGAGGGGTGGGSPACPYEGPPILDPATFDACSPACGGAHCVSAALVPAALQAQLDACTTKNGPGFCTPDVFIETAGNFIPPTCTSVAGAEGRCLSACLPAVESQAALLPQDTCGADEKCVPCYDPFTQAATGACALSCDPGPTKPPVTIECPYSGPPVLDPASLPACSPACAGAHCVPAAIIPAPLQAQLAACPGGFCAPDAITASGGQGVPASCTSVAGAEGRCLSTCLPAIAGQAALLPQATCAVGEKCAPCFDPTAADPKAPTGACSIACDAPTQPPVVLTCPWNGPPVVDPNVFPACAPACGGAHCVPAAIVPAAQQAQLAACNGGFCLPDPMIATAGNFVPKTCSPFANTPAEGRCLSDCLPAVASQIASLSQDVCANGEHCVPCYDPFSAQPTGACSSSACDAPKNPPYTFPTCCPFNGADGGTCSPVAAIPQAQQGSLQQLTCPAQFLCVPNEYLPNPPVPIETCATILGAGACVSQCTTVPGFFTQGSCSGNHVCVPCLLAASTPGCP